MKILWLYRYTPHRHYNHWFHTDFARVISEDPNIALKFYGWDMQKREDWADLLLMPYNERLTMSDLKKEFDYNVVILDCYNRAYTSVALTRMWLPPDFKDINVPKIVIEGDYHNQKDPKWYLNLNIDLIIHRHYSNVIRAKEDLSIQSIWLPCSIDNNIFKSNSDIQRVNKFCFAGEGTSGVYEYRRRASKILKLNNMLVTMSLIREEEYIKCLQSYISHVSCSSVFDLDIAKSFEIMSSGSVLYTDKCDANGFKELFPENSYCTYKRNFSDLLKNAEKIMNEPEYRKHLITNAMKCIAEKHTHQIRAEQLIETITKIFNLSYEPEIKEDAQSLLQKIKNFFAPKEQIVVDITSSTITESKTEIETNVQSEISVDLSLETEQKLRELYKICKVCVLGKTCYDIICNKIAGNSLVIAVNNEALAKKIVGEDFQFEIFPENTKEFIFKDITVRVPCPLIKYLTRQFGNEVEINLAKKNTVLKLNQNEYKFISRKKQR